MAWDNTVITNKGLEMLRQAIDGGELTIVSASGSDEIYPAASLMVQNTPANEKQNFHITEIKDMDNGIRVRVTITNDGLTKGYIMKQMCLWARLSKSEEQQIIAISQDEVGTAIPADGEIANYLMQFYVLLKVDTATNMKIIVENSAFVTLDVVEELLKNKADLINGKLPTDQLTIDNTPTEGSNNPISSGGAKKALDKKQNTEDSFSGQYGDLQNIPESFTPSAHTHSFNSIENRPESYPPSEHTHTFNSIRERPESYPPSKHRHLELEVLKGMTPPTTSTVGVVGQFYLCSDASNTLYQCVDVKDNKYLWKNTSPYKIGDILTTVRSSIGSGWLLCNGEVIDDSQYPDLANLLDNKLDSGVSFTPINQYVGSSSNLYETFRMLKYDEDLDRWFVGFPYYKSGSSGDEEICILYSDDGGNSWNFIRTGLSAYSNPNANVSIEYLNGHYIMCYESNYREIKIVYSTNLGTSWSTAFQDSFNSGVVDIMFAIYTSGTHYIYVGYNEATYCFYGTDLNSLTKKYLDSYELMGKIGKVVYTIEYRHPGYRFGAWEGIYSHSTSIDGETPADLFNKRNRLDETLFERDGYRPFLVTEKNKLCIYDISSERMHTIKSGLPDNEAKGIISIFCDYGDKWLIGIVPDSGQTSQNLYVKAFLVRKYNYSIEKEWYLEPSQSSSFDTYKCPRMINDKGIYSSKSKWGSVKLGNQLPLIGVDKAHAFIKAKEV